MENGTPLHEAAEAQAGSGAALRERSKQLVQQSRDELRVEQSSRPRRGQLRGLLIEEGIVEHTTHSDLELTGYCELKSELDRGLVLQTQHELLTKASAGGSYAQLKGILIQKGIRQDNGEGSCGRLDRELNDLTQRRFRPQLFIPSHIVGMTNYINEFSERLEARPDDTEWEKFRSCIREVHQFHLRNLLEQHSMQDGNWSKPTARDTWMMKDDLAQIKQDIDKLMHPLKKLAFQSQKLFGSIECIESRINQLDLRVEQFHERINVNMFKRQKSYEDMLTLSNMRERIGKKLANIETEIHESKELLRQEQSLEK